MTERRDMVVVTGGAGFIGSNLVHALNHRGITRVVVVDDLSDGHKFSNIADAEIADYVDLNEFRENVGKDARGLRDVGRIFHLGACSTTTEWDGRMMMDNNYTYSKELFHFCIDRAIPLVYASSAAVYGGSVAFAETRENENPLNVYAYSKLLFDRYVAAYSAGLPSQVAGLRYFNVYGPREQHKGGMASVAYHLNRQLLENGTVRLFDASHGLAAGEQCRDFIYVDDAVATTLWLADHAAVSGVFNCGTGRAETFNDVARAVIEWHGRGTIEYIPFPPGLREAYQSRTRADLDRLRGSGCDLNFMTVREGVHAYLDWLNA